MEKLAYRLKDSFSVFKEKLTSPKAVRIRVFGKRQLRRNPKQEKSEKK